MVLLLKDSQSATSVAYPLKSLATQVINLSMLSGCLNRDLWIELELSFVGHSDAVKQSHRFTGRFVYMACVL